MKIAVKVKTGARRDALWRDHDGLVAQICAVPKDGEANAYLEKYLAGCLRLPKSRVRIVRGHTSRYKMLEILANDSDLNPMIENLPEAPQASLFDVPEA